jgi:hypothetical protein
LLRIRPLPCSSQQAIDFLLRTRAHVLGLIARRRWSAIATLLLGRVSALLRRIATLLRGTLSVLALLLLRWSTILLLLSILLLRGSTVASLLLSVLLLRRPTVSTLLPVLLLGGTAVTTSRRRAGA